MAFAAAEAWAFTQKHPLTTNDFTREASKRGITISEALLRELWRIGALRPFAEIVDEPVVDPISLAVTEPRTGSLTYTLRGARAEGRLVDPSTAAFRPDVEFERPDMPWHEWWNGFIYTTWQLITLRWLHPLFCADASASAAPVEPSMDELSEWDRPRVEDAERRTNLLVALEARYLPEIRAPWLRLSDATWEEWDRFRAGFNPGEVLGRYGWTPAEVGESAMGLLNLARSWEPVGDRWSLLIRRASNRSWDELSGDMLCALDARIAAEILLRCYEDLVERGLAQSLDGQPLWHRDLGERLSARPMSIDRHLGALGLSPHPGVVLVVEGETEEFVLPHVIERIRLGEDDGVVRSSVMRGTHTGLTKLVAFVASPMIESAENDDWLLQRNPSKVLVAVDPDAPFDTAAAVKKQRDMMVDEIIRTVRAQGVDPVREDIEDYVEVRTWSEACFEFEHFTDEELADALVAVHGDCNGLNRETLVHVLGRHRADRHDIKQVWASWKIKPAKLALARQLLPLLLEQVDAASHGAGAPVPAVAGVVADAFIMATDRPRSGTWTLRGTQYPK